jgi:carbon storage regulator CsrA
MLILTRKVDEVIIIGDHIKVKVIQIRGKQVRLGIEAPPELLISREEEKYYEHSKGSLTMIDTNSNYRSSQFPKLPQP